MPETSPEKGLATAAAPADDPDARRHDIAAFLALTTLEGIGYWTLKKLAGRGVGFKALLKVETQDEFVKLLKDAGGKPKLAAAGWAKTQDDLWLAGKALRKVLAEKHVEVLLDTDPAFPPLAKQASDPPAWLFVQGSVALLREPSVALVGTRQPSEDGLYLATHLGHSLPMFAAATVSGLAQGIDQRIHSLSLRHKVPTIAVLGTGILKNFPAGSEDLRQQIVTAGGAVVSEYLPEQTYSAETFVRRNRIQAALARLVIPVEWAIKSGTAHTVEFARKLGRPILCPVVRDWPADRPEILHARAIGAEVVELPGDEAKLVQLVRHYVSRPLEPERADQLVLFSEE